MSVDGNVLRQGRQSPNRSSRGRSRVALVVLHYTGMVGAKAALDRLCDARSRVSTHYLIEPTGRIHALVPEAERAWHAGKACWAGERGINSASIGIELAHQGHAGGSRSYPEAQLRALEDLLADACRRWRLGPGSVVGHSDVAPTRKRDPGEWFPWERLAGKGLAAWTPGEEARDRATDDARHRMEDALAQIGYDTGEGGFRTPAAQACFRAFQRRFRPGELGQPLSLQAVLHGERIAEEWPGASILVPPLRACG